MRKIISLLCCFVICGTCYSQSENSQDSVKASQVISLKANENGPPDLKPALSIYPNPAKNKVTLQVKNFDPGLAMVKVLDIKGKIVREDNRLLTNGTEEIVMFLMLEAGIYFLVVSEPGKAVRKKLMIF